MTREERIDWLCRLRCWVVAPPLMTAEQKSKFIEALTETINTLQTEQNAYREGYNAHKRMIAREAKFNHYCSKCMGKMEPCEDAISRQAALDTFGLSDKTRKYGGDHSGYDTIMLYEVQDALEALPSVQPKPKTGYISIANVMSVFDDFMRGEVDEDGTETFLEMLKDKAESEDAE